MAQPPQLSGPPDKVDTTQQQHQYAMEHGDTKSCSGGGQEQDPDALLSPVPSAQFLASGDTTTITGYLEKPEEEESGGGDGQEHAPDASLLPVQPTQLFVCGDPATTGDSKTLGGGRDQTDPRSDPPTTALPLSTDVPTAGASTGRGSGQEQDTNASMPPGQPTRLSDFEDATSDFATLEGGRDEMDQRNDLRASAPSRQTKVPAVEASTGRGGGGGQEQDLDALLSSVTPTRRLFVSGDNTTTCDPENLEGGSSGSDQQNDHSTAISSVPSTVLAVGANSGGGSGSGSGGGSGDSNSTTLPARDSDVKLCSRFDRLQIGPAGGAVVKAKDEGKHKEEQLASLYTKIQDLETYVEIEASKRLEAECRAQNLVAGLQVLADRCDLEIGARETAESAAQRFMALCAEARAAWQKTQDIVQNKERELAAAEERLTRESKGGVDDVGSLQQRLVEARKDKEVVRQHSASLKLALEGGGAGSRSLRSPAGPAAAFRVAGDPAAEAAHRAPGNIGMDGGDGDDETVAEALHAKVEGRKAEEAEILSSPKAKLEGDRKAAIEARLEAAIAQADAEAGWRRLSKKITGPGLLEQKARLKDVQQQQQQQQQQSDHTGLPPARQKPTTRKSSHLSPSAPSYFPPSITAAALQKARQQQEAPQAQDNNPVMPLLDLYWEEPALAELGIGHDGQLLFASPSPATAPVAGADFFPEPLLPPRPHASPATKSRRETGWEDGSGDGGDNDEEEAGCRFRSDGAGSPVRLVLPPLSFSDTPPGNGGDRKRAEEPQSQPRTKSPAVFQELEEIYVSDDEDQPCQALGPLTQMFASSSIDGAGSVREANWPEDRVGGGEGNNGIDHGTVTAAVATSKATASFGVCDGTGSGTTVQSDGIREEMTAAAIPFVAGNGGCSGSEEKEDCRGISANSDAGMGEERDAVVRRAGAFLQALENEGYRSTIATLEVDRGSGVKVMSERKFLELHSTKRGAGELLAALDASGLAF